ncbi:DUF1924 domain-containing protein [Campylobacter sp. US33a]|uniref:DUF1924 domain-containing protein n=1 Tax=Campylobacter sp. US33a TaxID=2498120 RepID=UPI001067C55C|nr:DUF1924 domain-containing protein [Campylobacter sp. US33a]TEY03034.1 DUF1924 domain-containing protein [Campylobacter sp. US33a]
MKKIFLILVLNSYLFSSEFNQAMQEYINELKNQAKSENPSFVDFDTKRGEIIFSTKNKGKNGELISCQSCHNADLTKEATNIFTNKTIAPLAPSVNKNRLSDVKEVKKWLKRNFKDVYLREGSAIEKGDVLYYLIKQ